MKILLDRISMIQETGYAFIRNTQISVFEILDWFTNGATIEEILSKYTTLEKEDIEACIQWGSRANSY